MIEIGVISAAIVAITEGIKQMDIINIKYLPIVNLLLGIVFCVVYGGFDFKIGVFQGIIAGLTASGLYSGTKNIIQGYGGVN